MGGVIITQVGANNNSHESYAKHYNDAFGSDGYICCYFDSPYIMDQIRKTKQRMNNNYIFS